MARKVRREREERGARLVPLAPQARLVQPAQKAIRDVLVRRAPEA